jgi:hypothetical protein
MEKKHCYNAAGGAALAGTRRDALPWLLPAPVRIRFRDPQHEI